MKILNLIKRNLNFLAKHIVVIWGFLSLTIMLVFLIHSYINKYNKQVFVVDIKGSGEYESIVDAVTDIKSKKYYKDITLVVLPGEYEEIVDLRENTNINVLFLNKDNTKLIDKSGTYINSPLMVSGESYIRNANIVADHIKGVEIPQPYSYAVHFDYLGEGTTIFEDCTFESYQNSAVGIGMHENQTLIFKNCDFYSDSDYDGGTFYIHNSTESGVKNQKVILIDCNIVAEKGLALKIDDANIGSGDGLGNQMEMEFINCNFISNTLGEDCYQFTHTAIGDSALSGNIKLSPNSYGNNIDVLNAN